jgi:hypothetical protein
MPSPSRNVSFKQVTPSQFFFPGWGSVGLALARSGRGTVRRASSALRLLLRREHSGCLHRPCV